MLRAKLRNRNPRFHPRHDAPKRNLELYAYHVHRTCHTAGLEWWAPRVSPQGDRVHKAAQTVKSTPRTAYKGMLQDKLGRGGKTGRFFMVSPPAVSLDSGQSAGCGRCCGGEEEGTRGEPSGGPECEGMRRWDGETVRGCAGLWVCKISHCHLIYHQFTKQQLLSWIIWRTSRTRHNGSKSYFQKKKPMYVQDKRR